MVKALNQSFRTNFRSREIDVLVKIKVVEPTFSYALYSHHIFSDWQPIVLYG